MLAGWVTTEVGRQPYVIYGQMLTRDAISPVAAPAVGFTLGAFVIVYLVVFGAGIFYLLRLFAAGPEADVAVLQEGPLRSLAMSGERMDQDGN